jgi:hypothetical protein
MALTPEQKDKISELIVRYSGFPFSNQYEENKNKYNKLMFGSDTERLRILTEHQEGTELPNSITDKERLEQSIVRMTAKIAALTIEIEEAKAALLVAGEITAAERAGKIKPE